MQNPSTQYTTCENNGENTCENNGVHTTIDTIDWDDFDASIRSDGDAWSESVRGTH